MSMKAKSRTAMTMTKDMVGTMDTIRVADMGMDTMHTDSSSNIIMTAMTHKDTQTMTKCGDIRNQPGVKERGRDGMCGRRAYNNVVYSPYFGLSDQRYLLHLTLKVGRGRGRGGGSEPRYLHSDNCISMEFVDMAGLAIRMNKRPCSSFKSILLITSVLLYDTYLAVPPLDDEANSWAGLAETCIHPVYVSGGTQHFYFISAERERSSVMS